jgi:hypothetical protein
MSKVPNPGSHFPATSAPGGAQPEEEPAPPGRLPLVGAVIFALVAEGLLGIALVLGPENRSGLALLELGDLVISGLFALLICFLAGMVVRGRERVAWMLFGIACLGVLVAQGARLSSLQGLVSVFPNTSASLPSVSTLALALQASVLFLAFLVFPPALRQRLTISRVRQFFNGLLVVGAAAVGAVYFIFAPLPLNQGIDQAGASTITTTGTSLLLLIGLTFALRSVSAHPRPLRKALRLLALAAILLIGSNTASVLQMLNQPLSLASPLQAVWNAAYLCLGLGAMVRLRGAGQTRAEEQKRGSSSWEALPFIIVVLMAGAIVGFALTNGTHRVIALACLSLLVALVGARYLVSVFESHQMDHENQLLARELTLMNEEFDHARAEQQAQAARRQASLRYIQDTLTHFMQGRYESRVQVEGNELAPLEMDLNLLLDGVDRQLHEHDRSRELLIMRTLVEAMGRLALGELHDLPDLPPPSGTPVDALAKGIIQVRTRLLNLQGAIQHYQTEQQQLQQELAALRKQVDLEMQGEQQLLMQMNQDLEEQLKTERQVAQVAEEQLQKERLSAQARIQAAEARAQEAEATLAAAEERLRLDYEALERRMKTERQELEERLRAAPQTDLTRATRLRQQSEEFTSAFSEQSERLYTSAAALQTAAEVARRIARSIQETAALPGLRSAEAPAPAPAPAASSPGPQTLSAMQLLEQLAGIRQTESAPLTPPPTSGALPGTASHEIIKRLNTVASRAEEMAGGLQDLSSELVKEGDTSKEAAEKAELLKTELEHLAQTTPATLRAKLPVRSSRNERP